MAQALLGAMKNKIGFMAGFGFHSRAFRGGDSETRTFLYFLYLFSRPGPYFLRVPPGLGRFVLHFYCAAPPFDLLGKRVRFSRGGS